MITQENRDLLFFAFIPELEVSDFSQTLEQLSGHSMRLGPDDWRSNVTETVERIWETAICDLTCAQVRMLVGQKMGLNWIAEPVAHFIKNHPSADIDFYPGDLTVAALRAFDEISSASTNAANLIRSADFGWVDHELSFEPELIKEVHALLASI